MTSVDDLTQGLDQLRDSIAQTARAAPQVARQEIKREGRAYFRGAVVASVITSLLIGVPLLLLNRRLAENTAEDQVRAAQFRAASQDIQRLAQGAYDLGVVANAELTRRGLATVAIPAPGTASDSAVLSAASTAQVAVQIARESIAVPTPAEIQAEVTAQLAKLPPPPIGPTPQQLDEAVQAYLAANAEALRGPRGDQGEPGKSPPCLAELTQCQGIQGEQGLRGDPPVGWTVAEADGSITTCERIEGFDPAAPRYHCSHGAPPPPPAMATTTTPPPPPSDEGLLPLPVG